MVQMYQSSLIALTAGVLLAGSASAESLRIAEMAADRCMYDQALQLLQKAPEVERSSRRGLLLRGRLLIQLHRGAEAVKALNLVPKSKRREDEADRLLALGLALSEAGRLADAERALTEAKAAGADRDIVDEGIGTLRIQAGRLNEAETQLRDVLRRAPLLSGALYNLAVVRVRQGDLAEAGALIRQSWHAGLQDPDQLKTDPDLEELRKQKGLIDDLLAATIPRCNTY